MKDFGNCRQKLHARHFKNEDFLSIRMVAGYSKLIEAESFLVAEGRFELTSGYEPDKTLARLCFSTTYGCVDLPISRGFFGSLFPICSVRSFRVRNYLSCDTKVRPESFGASLWTPRQVRRPHV